MVGVQVSRYLQKLEKELGKFKAELEADSEGLTDVLEQMAMKEVSRGPGNCRTWGRSKC